MQAEKIQVRWPDGSVESVKDITADRRIIIRQGGGLQKSEKFLSLPGLLRS
jgi:hypothetical protein